VYSGEVVVEDATSTSKELFVTMFERFEGRDGREVSKS
jgi:hypothetical protein